MKKWQGFGFVAGGLIAVALVQEGFKGSATSDYHPPPMISDEPVKVLQIKTGCKNLDTLSEIADFVRQGDAAAAETARDRAILNGSCRVLMDGDTVYVTDRSVFRHAVQVRPQGKTERLWAWQDLLEPRNGPAK